MIHGPSGGGKTFVVLDMCLHLAAGRTGWHDLTAHPAPVVYLAGEGHQGLRGRIAAWKQHNQAERLNMWLSSSGTDLNTTEGYHKTRQALMSLPESPKLIVVDTLHRFLLGDENSAQDAKTMLDACNALQQEFECSVVLVHHTGVSEDAQHRARGSSAWRGALDIEISVAPQTEDEPLRLIQRKAKDSELCQPKAFRLQSVYINGWHDEDGEQVSSAVIVPDLDFDSGMDNKTQKHLDDFMKAWQSSGQEDKNGCPYLSRSALKEWLKLHVTESEDQLKKILAPSTKGKMIHELTKHNIIARSGAGFIKLQNGHEAAEMLLLSKNNDL